jgi:hypothetical protein
MVLTGMRYYTDDNEGRSFHQSATPAMLNASIYTQRTMPLETSTQTTWRRGTTTALKISRVLQSRKSGRKRGMASEKRRMPKREFVAWGGRVVLLGMNTDDYDG